MNTVNKRIIKHRRIRAKITGTALRPRMTVFRSNQHIYAQLIDDVSGKTLAQFNDLALDKKEKTGAKVSLAQKVGEVLGAAIIKKGFKEIVFERGGYKYHGRIKALAEGLRGAGIKF